MINTSRHHARLLQTDIFIALCFSPFSHLIISLIPFVVFLHLFFFSSLVFLLVSFFHPVKLVALLLGIQQMPDACLSPEHGRSDSGF